MDKKGSSKTKAKEAKTSKEKNSNNKSYQIIMKKEVHQLLKERAQQQKMPIGELIQNLLASLENRLERYKVKYFGENLRSDKLDARLIKFLMIKDDRGFSQDDINSKLEQIKNEFEQTRYKPEITLND